MARLARAEVFNPTSFTLSSVRGPTSWPRERCLRDAKLNFQASVLSKAFQTGTGRNGLVPDEDSLGPQLATLMQLCEATRIDEPIPVFRHREAMAKGNKEGIRPSDHHRAIA